MDVIIQAEMRLAQRERVSVVLQAAGYGAVKAIVTEPEDIPGVLIVRISSVLDSQCRRHLAFH
jgi:hypothetical protein